MRPVFLAALLCALPLTAANAADFAGKFTSADGGYRQEADITAAAGGTYEVDVYVGTEGCSGAFEGVGQIEGAKLVAHLTEPGDACRLTMSRTATGIKIDEDGCFAWHGPSCSFDGTLRQGK